MQETQAQDRTTRLDTEHKGSYMTIMSEVLGGVFTNGMSSGGADLLQQAFQQVVNEEEESAARNKQQQQQQQQQNSFLAFLEQNNAVSNNGDAPQVIHLTTEQAAALGINVSALENSVTIENESCEGEISYQDCGQEEMQMQQTQLSQEDTQRILNELAQSGLLKAKNEAGEDVVLEDWQQQQQQQNGQSENHSQKLVESNVTMENDNDCQSNQIDEQTSNFLHIQTIGPDEQCNPKDMEVQHNDNLSQNTIQFSIASSSPQVGNVTKSQAQILQKFPVILPSSQFILKPAQTVLTPVKNFRILPSATKVGTNVQTSQNSLLLPKTTCLNTISPQLIKAMPIGTQFLSTTNNLSAQLLNASQLISKANSINISSSGNNHVVKDSLVNTSVNNMPTVTQHLVRQTSVQRPGQTQVHQKANLQQYFTPILKSTSNAIAVVKNTSLLNSKAIIKQTNNITSTTPILKSINPSMLKTSLIKSLPVSKSGNSPVIFKTTPVIKTDELLKASTINSSRTQISSNPMSILKPQTKTVVNGSSLIKQNLTSLLAQKQSALSKPLELNNGLKPLVTAKLKQSVNSIMKSMKKKPITKLITVNQSPTTSANNKPLGSTENPIQIVQQGETYHSVNRLTQAQLKHIAQVLQQRTQDSGNPNDKVVYRLTFHDDQDPRMRNSSSLLKNRNNKRGRPKKSAVKTPVAPNKAATEEEQDDSKDDRKKIVARTRSGRLSRPPRHMVRDYKHLHHMDLSQPDLDDSDGGYSDYNTSNASKVGPEDEEALASQRTELLAGLEMPKRKISDDFRCSTCNKIYLGRTRMIKHFEMHPDHGSMDQLPPLAVEADLKQTTPQDPLKRKGKKRGPWAYTTPEAKSERRQLKLQEAISVCNNTEIVKIAAKPVVNSLSLFDMLLLKSENNVRSFLSEIKELVERVREKTGTMLSAVNSDDDKFDDEVVDLNEELLCDVLALNSGFYRVNEPLSVEEPEIEERSELSENFEINGSSSIEPPLKMQKTEHIMEEVKESVEESGYSESSDLSVNEFFNERRSDPPSKSNCPEVLSALTLVPRNGTASPTHDASTEVNTASKVLNPGVEIHNADTPGFQKLSINAETKANPNFIKEGAFTKLGDSLEPTCSDVFTKFNGNFDQSKMESMQRTFIKLEPTEEGFIKLENGMLGGFHEEMEDFGKIQSNGFHYVSGSLSNSFSGKGFRKLVPKSMGTATVHKQESLDIVDSSSSHAISENSIQITTSSNSNGSASDATNMFESSDNLDITKITSYDHIGHLDILNGSGAIDKNLMIDEKLVEHLQLVDNTNLNIVDEIVSERLKSMMPDNVLDGNLLQHNGHLDTELDFEDLTEEFNRNTRS